MVKTNLVKNTLLLAVGEGLRVLINFIAVPLFSSWLSTGDYGTFDLVVTYVSLFIPFVTLANSESLFRLGVETEDDADLSGLIGTSLLIDVIGFSCVALCVIILSFFVHSSILLPFLFMLAGQVGLDHFRGCTRALRKLSYYAFANVIASLGNFIAVAVLVFFLRLGLLGILCGSAVGNIAGCVAAFFLVRYWEHVSLQNATINKAKEMLSYSLPLVPNNISWWIINVSDRSMIGFAVGSVANGIYAVACKVPNLCTSIFGVFGVSWQETASDLVGSEERNSYYNSVLNKTIKTMLSTCAVVLTLTFPLFDLMFELRYHDAMLYVPILVTSVAFNSLALYFGGIQISLKRPKENGITTMLGAIANVVINAIFIPFFGIFAAATSTLVANAVIFFSRYWRLRFDIPFQLERDTVYSIIVYILFFAASYFVSSYLLFFPVFAGALLYFFLTNQDFLKMLVQKVSRIIRWRD